MKESSLDSPSGSIKKIHGIVLNVVGHQENDLILTCLTAEFGKISCYARSARRSKKRFPPALMQPLNHLQIQVRVPKGLQLGKSEMWILESAELKDHFLHLKSSYEVLEWISHFVRLTQDTLPADHSDPAIFRSLGRSLRDSFEIDRSHSSEIWPWFFWSYWNWFSNHLGWGHALADMNLDNTPGERIWSSAILDEEFNAKNILQILNVINLQPISKNEWLKFYRKWSSQTGIQWVHFERWLGIESTRSQELRT